MEKPLPKKVETEPVKKLLNETHDIKLEPFEERINEKFDEKFGKLSKQIDMVGVLI